MGQKRNHKTSSDKKNHTTQKNHGTTWDKQHHATSEDKKITLPIGPIASKLFYKALNCSK